MLIGIRGAGDIASGIACRLSNSGFSVVMTDLPIPTAIRRTVCFSEAIRHGSARVETVEARLAADAAQAKTILGSGCIAVLADETGRCFTALRPAVLIDAILAKQNLGTAITDAPVVIALGPGFTAGQDCDAVVETMRGHTLGRVYYEGGALPNTGVPGSIGGFTIQRVLRAPTAGVFQAEKQIGDRVQPGELIARVGEEAVIRAPIAGVLRGLLSDGMAVQTGMKCGDIDPRCEVSHCYQVSDKALAIAGGVLEAILHLTGGMHHGI